MTVDIEDQQSLSTYLKSRGVLSHNTELRSFGVLRGGVSNKAILITLPDERQWVLKQALAKLRVKADWFSSPQRVHREAAGMRALAGFCPAGSITPFIFEDETHHILAMEAVPPPHENLKSLFLAGEVQDDWIIQFASILSSIHRESAKHRNALTDPFEDRTFFESLRLEPYYSYSAEREPRARAFIAALCEETRRQNLSLVHGDYSPKNFLVHHGQLVLLDHEVIHLGDPAFDIGFAMTHLLSKAHHLAASRDAFVAAARIFWTRYAADLGQPLAGPELEARGVRHTLGCLLARVAGRSPLEYLSPAEQQRQREAVIELVAQPPAQFDAMIDRFIDQIERG